MTDIDADFARYARDMTRNLTARRVGTIIGTNAKTMADMFAAMTESCLTLHATNHVATPYETGLSVGLVRIAHVKNAVAFARHLEQCAWPDSSPVVKVVLYHSRNTVLARALIERRLDLMLYRKAKEKPHPLAPLQDQDLLRVVQDAARSRRDVCVLVVATSVEEVGRDHDFDWAVIEPSSARSIVQSCGRVMRHRLETPQSANVAVLARNFRELVRLQRNQGYGPSFCRPGFETEGRVFASHDIEQAIVRFLPSERKTAAGFLIDARMCLAFDSAELGALENGSIDETLKAKFLTDWASRPVMSMVCKHYVDHRFRAGNSETEITLDFDANVFSQDSFDIGEVEGSPMHTTNILGRVALWTLDWGGIVQQFEGLDTADAAFCKLSVPRTNHILSDLLVDPLYGFVSFAEE